MDEQIGYESPDGFLQRWLHGVVEYPYVDYVEFSDQDHLNYSQSDSPVLRDCP